LIFIALSAAVEHKGKFVVAVAEAVFQSNAEYSNFLAIKLLSIFTQVKLDRIP